MIPTAGHCILSLPTGPCSEDIWPMVIRLLPFPLDLYSLLVYRSTALGDRSVWLHWIWDAPIRNGREARLGGICHWWEGCLGCGLLEEICVVSLVLLLIHFALISVVFFGILHHRSCPHSRWPHLLCLAILGLLWLDPLRSNPLGSLCSWFLWDISHAVDMSRAGLRKSRAGMPRQVLLKLLLCLLYVPNSIILNPMYCHLSALLSVKVG